MKRRRITFVFEEPEEYDVPGMMTGTVNDLTVTEPDDDGLVLPNGQPIPRHVSRRQMGFRPPEDPDYGVTEPPP